MVGFNSVPLKVADVASVADEERRNESLRISVSSRDEPVLKSKRNPHKLDLGAGIDTFCRNGPSIVGPFLLLCRLTQFARALGGDLDAPCNGRSNSSIL
jgi:hypothetical protein